ncbi:MAG: hypothetical protein L0Z54_03305, partial [Thermoplasmata archaeon]|nr:hypothetical protein [Thermoplasmata archaeon]
MIPERMVRVQIVVPRERTARMTALLHEAGVLQLEAREARATDLHDALRSEAKRVGTLVRITRPLHGTKRASVAAAVRPAPVVPIRRPLREPRDVLDDTRGLVAEHERTLDAHSRRKGLRARRKAVLAELHAIAPVLDAPVRLSEVGERKGYALFFVSTDGSVPSEALWSNADRSVALVALIGAADAGRFERMDLPVADALPSDRAGELHEELRAIDSEIGDLDSVIAEAHPSHAAFLAAREDIRNAMRQEATSASFGGGTYLSHIEGWVPASGRERVEGIVRAQEGGLAHATFEERDDGPTYVRHPRWAEPFAGMVALYGTPG